MGEADVSSTPTTAQGASQFARLLEFAGDVYKRQALSIMGGHAAEGALIDLAFLRARERNTIVFEFDDRGGRLLAHEFDGVLVAQPIRPLHRVVHVPTPVVRAHVTERGADAALRGDGVATRCLLYTSRCV